MQLTATVLVWLGLISHTWEDANVCNLLNLSRTSYKKDGSPNCARGRNKDDSMNNLTLWNKRSFEEYSYNGSFMKTRILFEWYTSYHASCNRYIHKVFPV